MKTVVVTGSEGFIGRCLTTFLLDRGYNVIGIDRIILSDDLHEFYTFYYGDITDSNFLDHIHQVFASGNLAGIVHLAADSLLGPSVKDPLSYYKNNVSNSLEFVEYLITKKIFVPFIFASSAAVYGNQSGICRDDDTNIVLNPINPYGHTKLVFEFALKDFASAYNFNSTAFRFFNVVGGIYNKRLNKYIGQRVDQPHILPSLYRAYRDKTPFVLNGDGETLRDYIHVEDVCTAIESCISFGITSEFTAYNLCTGIPYSNFDVADIVLGLGFDHDLGCGPKRSGDPDCLIGESSFIKSGWAPRFSMTDKLQSAFSAFIDGEYVTIKGIV